MEQALASERGRRLQRELPGRLVDELFAPAPAAESRDDCLRRVEDAVSRALSRGFDTEPLVRTYVELWHETDGRLEDAPEHARVREALGASQVTSPAARLALARSELHLVRALLERLARPLDPAGRPGDAR